METLGLTLAAELVAAFTKRLRNCTPPTAAIGRWSHETSEHQGHARHLRTPVSGLRPRGERALRKGDGEAAAQDQTGC